MSRLPLRIPPHFDPDRVGEVWRVPYLERAREAEEWSRQFGLKYARHDSSKICLVAVDVQNTFCIPGFELYVAGRSGRGAIDDNVRLCEFIYRNLDRITRIAPTMDTHQAMQIFHQLYLIDEKGNHPDPFTLVTEQDVEVGRWRFNPEIAFSFGVTEEYGRRHLLHYVRELRKGGKYDLTVWPYHAMLGGIGHALVSAVEEAIFFHSVARFSRADFHVKGDRPFTEHYSVLGPEVLRGPDGAPIGEKSEKFFSELIEFDAVVIAGQAKSHCVAWTIDDLLRDLLAHDAALVKKVYLLEDCTSPVVIPGVIDYTERADEAFQRFRDAGMHIVRSTDPIETWPGISF